MGKSCRHKFSLCANCIANQVSPITLVRHSTTSTLHVCDGCARAPSRDVRDFSFFLFPNHMRAFSLFVRSIVRLARNLSLHFSLAFGRRAQSILIPLKTLSIRFFTTRLICSSGFFSLLISVNLNGHLDTERVHNLFDLAMHSYTVLVCRTWTTAYRSIPDSIFSFDEWRIVRCASTHTHARGIQKKKNRKPRRGKRNQQFSVDGKKLVSDTLFELPAVPADTVRKSIYTTVHGRKCRGKRIAPPMKFSFGQSRSIQFFHVSRFEKMTKTCGEQKTETKTYSHGNACTLSRYLVWQTSEITRFRRTFAGLNIRTNQILKVFFEYK